MLKNISGEIWQHFHLWLKNFVFYYLLHLRKRQVLRFKEEAKPSLTIFLNLGV
ncbi:hypothetical protein DB41_KI00130 [Neochlamydia sp. TUME1]|nr:hypothetical protein DB41_KI00130 [Neochlamydia sp. TUME1]